MTIDIECGDTIVFIKLLSKYENIRVMYMFYGDYRVLESPWKLAGPGEST
jgi:hypothetical protein